MNRSYTVNSNVSLHYIPMEKLKTTTIGVYIHRSLNEEEASMNALLPYVLKRGCKLCADTGEIARYLENLYGADLSAGVLKKGEDQIIAFDAETIQDRFAPEGEKLTEELLKLLMSIIFEPLTENGGFKKDFVEREKLNAIDRAEGVINDKRAYAQLRCTEEMCKGQPFAVSKLGTVEGIKNITSDSLYDYYRKMIAESAIDIFVSGDADIEKISGVLKENIKIPPEKAKIQKTEILQNNDGVKNITEKMDITQGKLCVGFKTNIKPQDDEFVALMIANGVFGAGAHSKLFNNVREKLSLCYYASSQLDKFKGLLLINAGIEFENFQKAYDEILVQLEAVKKGDISDFEFEASVNTAVNSFQSAYDDPRSMQSVYLGEIICGTENTVADYIRKIKAVTKDDIVSAINKIELDTVYFLTGRGEEK